MLRSLEENRRLLSRKAVSLTHNNSAASVNRVTREQVRVFLLARYARAIQQLGLDSATVTDDFDFLLRQVIDSFGILEMILSIEDEFHIQLDMTRLDAEQITILHRPTILCARSTIRVCSPVTLLNMAGRIIYPRPARSSPINAGPCQV